MADLKQAKEVELNMDWVNTLRKDFLLLMRNVEKVSNFDEAETLRQAFNVFRKRFDDLFFQEFMNRHLKYQMHLDTDRAKQADDYIRETAWAFEMSLQLPLDSWEVTDGKVSKEMCFANFQRRSPKWETATRKKAQAFWKRMREMIELYGGAAQKFDSEVADTEVVEIEGFRCEIHSFRVRPEKMEVIKEGLRQYRERAQKYLPILLAYQTPITFDFASHTIDLGGEYKDGHVFLYPINITSPSVLANFLAHEMGHHLWKVLSSEVTNSWYQTINGDFGSLDVKHLVEHWPGDAWTFQFGRVMGEKDPTLALQVEALSHDRSYPELNTKADFQKLLDSGETILKVPNTPITGYANKNPQEAFCEAIGMLIGYGPRAVHERVRHWLDWVLPETSKTASLAGGSSLTDIEADEVCHGQKETAEDHHQDGFRGRSGISSRGVCLNGGFCKRTSNSGFQSRVGANQSRPLYVFPDEKEEWSQERAVQFLKTSHRYVQVTPLESGEIHAYTLNYEHHEFYKANKRWIRALIQTSQQGLDSPTIVSSLALKAGVTDIEADEVCHDQEETSSNCGVSYHSGILGSLGEGYSRHRGAVGGGQEEDQEDDGRVISAVTKGPVQVFHGTDADFEDFDEKFLGTANGTAPINRAGFSFTNSRAVAETFGKNVHSVFVDIKHPLVIDAKGQDYSQFKHVLNRTLEKVDRSKYDGLIIRNYADAGLHGDDYIISDHFIPFSASQIHKQASQTKTAEARVHSFGCVMIRPKAHTAELVRKVGTLLIKDHEVYTDPEDPSYGLEQDPHVTCLWGIKPTKVGDRVAKVAQEHAPSHFRLGNVSLFPAEGDTPYDVVKFDVDRDGLKEFHDALLEEFPDTEETYDYHPHMTLGYVKAGCGEKVLARVGKWQGKTVEAESVTYSRQDGELEVFDLQERGELTITSKTASKTLKTDSIWGALSSLKTHKMISMKKVERNVIQSPESAYWYALTVLEEDRFELAEPAIAKDPEWAYRYALTVLEGRFELGEQAISRDRSYRKSYQDFLESKGLRPAHPELFGLTKTSSTSAFPGSKIVDKEGNPLICYHGTSAEFEEFDIPENGVAYFTPDPNYGHIKHSPKVIAAYLNIQNPYCTDYQSEVEGAWSWPEWIAELKAEGYDGIVYSKKGDLTRGASGWGDDRPQFVVFSPAQIERVDMGDALIRKEGSATLRLYRGLEQKTSGVRDHIPTFQEMLETFEGDITEDDRQRYEYHVRALRKLQFPLPIFRHVFVKNRNSVNLQAAGRFWSSDESLAFSHNGGSEGETKTLEEFMKPQAPDAPSVFNEGMECLLRAVVEPHQIDWVDTVYARISFGEDEAEISIEPGTTITLTGIKFDDGQWEPQSKSIRATLHKEAYSGADKERSIWYHGTSTRNLRSILSQGLILPTRSEDMNWGKDEDASINSPDRTSYGGIYLTRNLRVARNASRERRKPTLIVCCSIQPRSLTVDEDDLKFMFLHPMGEISQSDYSAPSYYIAATQPDPNTHMLAKAEGMKATFVSECMDKLKQRLEDRLHPSLVTRLETLLGEAWLPAVGRNVAHLMAKAKDYEKARAFREGIRDRDTEMPADVFPTITEAESAFRRAVDPITRTLKSLARPEVHKNDFRATARVMEPITYSGSNRIMCVVEIGLQPQDAEGRTDYSQPYPLTVHYGELPEDFLEQWQMDGGSYVLRKPGETEKTAGFTLPTVAVKLTGRWLDKTPSEPKLGGQEVADDQTEESTQGTGIRPHDGGRNSAEQERIHKIYRQPGAGKSRLCAYRTRTQSHSQEIPWFRGTIKAFIESYSPGKYTHYRSQGDLLTLYEPARSAELCLKEEGGDLYVHREWGQYERKMPVDALPFSTEVEGKTSSLKTASRSLSFENVDHIQVAAAAYRHKMISSKKLFPRLSTHPFLCYYFAAHLGRPMPELEDVIAKDSGCSLSYAKYVLKPNGINRFEKGEPGIAMVGSRAMEYALDVLEGPFPAGEDAIILQGGGHLCFRYARDILKGSFPEGEKAISRDPWATNVYLDYLKSIDKEPAQPELFKEAEKNHLASGGIGSGPNAVTTHGKFWGRAGAGCVFLARDTGRALLAYRSLHVNEPHTWGVWGGALHDGETPLQGAQREAYEETGYRGSIEFEQVYVYTNGDFQYTTFIAWVPTEFTPDLNWETETFRWCAADEWPKKLHFGLKACQGVIRERQQGME